MSSLNRSISALTWLFSGEKLNRFFFMFLPIAGLSCLSYTNEGCLAGLVMEEKDMKQEHSPPITVI